MSNKQTKHRYRDALSQVSWQDFERLFASYYADQGYRVEHVGTGGSGMQFDGGIDLKLYRDDQYLIVQCKHWNVLQVTHNAVHELLGVMLTERANGAIVITSGEFSNAAKVAAAKEPRVTLIDGAALRNMIGLNAEKFAPSESGRAGSSGHVEFDRQGPRSHHRLSPVRKPRPRNPLPGIVAAIVVGLICYAFVRYTLNEFALKMASPVPAVATSRSYIASSTPIMPVLISTAVPNPTIAPPEYRITHMSQAEQRAWRRKNDESMKIIDATTAPLAR